ncbi:hypothetical protein, partial [Pontiella sp.]|uniref:hypothetical protein n=1 Tax=Pontiella sp. TaxID=2837462 RepID=UPI003569A2D2
MKKTAVLIAGLALAGVAFADFVKTVPLGEGGTQLGAGATNTTKDNLDAENGSLWGVSNANDYMGLRYWTFSDIAGAGETIQTGTYTLSLRVGNGNVFAFSGLNTPVDGDTSAGVAAGFFETAPVASANAATARNNAQTAKNNMYLEFNGVSGVTYTAPTEAAPADLTWTTWTFTWEVAEGSSVIGKDLYFGVYNKTGGNGSAFFDDSTLSYAIPEPATLGLLAAFGGGILFIRRL